MRTGDPNPELEDRFLVIAQAVRLPLSRAAAPAWRVGLAPSEEIRRAFLDIWEPEKMQVLTLFPLAVPRTAYLPRASAAEPGALLQGLAQETDSPLGPDPAPAASLLGRDEAWDNHNLSWRELTQLREQLGHLPVAQLPSPLSPPGGQLIVLWKNSSCGTAPGNPAGPLPAACNFPRWKH